MANERRFVGIDPSTKMGFVILDEQGETVVDEEITSPTADDPQRFIYLAKQVIMQLKEGDKVCIEGFAYGAQGRGQSFQYILGGYIRILLFQNGIKYMEIPPTQLKSFVASSGRATKEAMMQAVERKWDFVTASDNIADAYGLAQMARGFFHKEDLSTSELEVINKIQKQARDAANGVKPPKKKSKPKTTRVTKTRKKG